VGRRVTRTASSGRQPARPQAARAKEGRRRPVGPAMMVRSSSGQYRAPVRWQLPAAPRAGLGGGARRHRYTRAVSGANLLPVDGLASLEEAWLPSGEADELMARLVDGLDWQQEHARFGAKVVALPRLTAWYGDAGYGYSGVYHPPRPWPPVLDQLRSRLVRPDLVGGPGGRGPNTVLVNYYRGGQDSMGWHSDDEAVLGPAPTIWSVSLGATRRFLFRHRASGQRVEISLSHGSLLVMGGQCQHCWQHCLPKTAQPVGPRVNLTFRSTAPAADVTWPVTGRRARGAP